MTAYEVRISDWSSDVCSSDLDRVDQRQRHAHVLGHGLVEAEDLDRAHGRRAGRAAGEQEHGCGGDAGEGRGHAGSITGARQEAINGSAIRSRIRACGRRRPGFAVETHTRNTSTPEAAPYERNQARAFPVAKAR